VYVTANQQMTQGTNTVEQNGSKRTRHLGISLKLVSLSSLISSASFTQSLFVSSPNVSHPSKCYLPNVSTLWPRLPPPSSPTH
jgi:hypothetical protein